MIRTKALFTAAVGVAALLVVTAACDPVIPLPLPTSTTTPLPPTSSALPTSSTTSVPPPTSTTVAPPPTTTHRPPPPTTTHRPPPPPTTTTVVRPPSTTVAPPPAGDTTAAVRFGWGTPLASSDEFSYTGSPDSAKWTPAGECWPGHAGNGRRCASRSTVAGGFLRETGLTNGDTGWLENRTNQLHGRWEARVRIGADGASGHPYHPVLLTWPKSDVWPQSGEYDFWEVNVGDARSTAFIHHPANSVIQDEYHSGAMDLTQWHNYAVEWVPGHIRGYIDGAQWFDTTDPNAQAPEPMHGTIQLDNFFGASGMQPAHMDVDWYRVYGA